MYRKFHQKMTSYLVFSIKDIEKEFPKFDKKNLIYWQKKGYVLKIRNGYYCFFDIDKTEQFLYYTANKIYSPSYISLESALSFYQIIPEGVFTITSISTLKTNTFDTPTGNFVFRHFKPSLFFGYQLVAYGKQTYKIASMEKTILDFIYLNPKIKKEEDFKSLRWNKKVLQEMDFELFEKYLLIFNSKALNSRIKSFKKYLYA